MSAETPPSLTDLRALTLPEAEEWFVAQGQPRFRGEQVWRWIHGKGARSWDEMTNLSAALREELKQKATIGTLGVAEVEPERRITNIVYMGMGEPLHNYDNVLQSLRILTSDKGAGLSQRRITVSTVGLVPKIAQLGREDVRPHRAVSLNASSNEIRDRIMPVNKKYPIETLLDTIRAYPLEHRRRVTFEYVLLAGVTDSLADAARLAKLLRGIRCKVNIIPWNPHPESDFQRPSDEAIEGFQNECKRLGLPTYLRTPRGDDIDAACGQLALRKDGQTLVPLRVRKQPRA